ncbi:hypothetical protein AOLI_G00042150 [Acnodon oligacanthus]
MRLVRMNQLEWTRTGQDGSEPDRAARAVRMLKWPSRLDWPLKRRVRRTLHLFKQAPSRDNRSVQCAPAQLTRSRTPPRRAGTQASAFHALTSALMNLRAESQTNK